MKKIFLIFLLIAVSTKNNTAQTYRQLFDNLNGNATTTLFRTGFYSLYSNINTSVRLASNADAMQAYITMYKATKDVKYLHEFVIHAKRVMDRRDDHISSANPVLGFPAPVGACSIVNITSPSFLSTTGYPAWSRLEVMNPNPNICQLVPFPHFMETGGILYPMAQFVLLIMEEEQNLATINLPTEATFGTTTTFGSFASYLRDNIYVSLDWHIWKDYNRFAFGCNGCNAFVSITDGWRGINLQCAIGKPLVLMYHLAQYENTLHNDPTFNSHESYSVMINSIAGALAGDVAISSNTLSTVGPGLQWYKWCHANIPHCDGDLMEDIAHAHIDEEFAELCYKYLPQSQSFFDESDMQKFANGLAYKMIPQPLRFTMNVRGDDSDCNQMCPPDVTDHPRVRYPISGIYPFLSQYNKQIYQEISDFYVPDNVNFFNSQGEIITFQAYANLALYQNLFNPIAAKGEQSKRTGITSNVIIRWLNSASGDFNNDGSDEFAAVSMNIFNTGQLAIYSLTSGNVIVPLTGFFQAAYTDIAGGNFDISNGGDEIAVLNASNVISLLKLNNGNIISFGSNFTPPETILSLGSGDFNNDGRDEIVALSSSNVFIYQISSGNLSLLTSFSASGYNKVTIGKYEGSNTAEIAALKTSGNITIFNSTGSNLYSAQAPAGTYTNSIASGDYDGDGISEIMVYGSSDATFRMFKVRSGVLSYIPNMRHEEVFPVNQQQGVMCSCRLSNYSDKDALATFRNYDGQVNVFTMDGLCPSLSLNNQTIDNNSYMNSYTNVSNNYPIDYHVNNTLSAGNYIIQPPSKIDFIAGNKIILKPGFIAKAGSKFHAYISPGLACSNDGNFRTNNTNKPSKTHTQQIHEQTKGKEIASIKSIMDNKIQLEVFPNPGNGSYTLRTKNEDNYTVEIYNMFGAVIQTVLFTGNEKQINIENFNSGIYNFVIKTKDGTSNNIKVVKD